MKKTSIFIVTLFIFFLLGTAGSAFAGPDKNQACDHVSDKGKAEASSKSVVGSCEPPAEEEPPFEPPPEDPPPPPGMEDSGDTSGATSPSNSECTDPMYAMNNPTVCLGM